MEDSAITLFVSRAFAIHTFGGAATLWFFDEAPKRMPPLHGGISGGRVNPAGGILGGIGEPVRVVNRDPGQVVPARQGKRNWPANRHRPVPVFTNRRTGQDRSPGWSGRE
jgi:hypothetical protein